MKQVADTTGRTRHPRQQRRHPPRPHGQEDDAGTNGSSVLQTNLDGVFYCSKLGAEVLRDGGRIVNIASISGIVGFHGQANYAAAKAGVIALTKVLAKELARRGITVNAVAPGVIQTPMLDGLKPEVLADYEKQIPVGRVGTAGRRRPRRPVLRLRRKQLHHRSNAADHGRMVLTSLMFGPQSRRFVGCGTGVKHSTTAFPAPPARTPRSWPPAWRDRRRD